MGRNQGGRCKCEACGASFSSLSAFDAHRVGAFAGKSTPSSRRCLNAGEMRARKMVENDRGDWATSAGSFDWAKRTA